MIINTQYRLGSYVDLCHCPCNNNCGYWQTSCPSCFNPCLPCNNSNFNCCPGPPICYDNINFSIPKNAAFFMAGYLISKGIYKN